MDSDSDSDSSDSSHNSDCSKDLPFDFKVQQGSTAERNQPQPEPGSGSDSDSSGLSSKSDRSKGCPFDFNNQQASAAESQGNRETPHSTALYIEPSSIEDEGEEVYLNLQLTLGTTDEDKQKPDEQCQMHKRLKDFYRLWIEPAKQKGSVRKRSMSGDHESHTEAQRKKMKSKYSCVSAEKYIGFQKKQRPKRSMSGKHESQTRAQRNQPGAEAGPSSRLDSDSRGQYKEFQFDVQQASATESPGSASGSPRSGICLEGAQEAPRSPLLAAQFAIQSGSDFEYEYFQPAPRLETPYHLPQPPFSHHQFPQLAHTPKSLSSGQLDTSNLVGPGLDDEWILKFLNMNVMNVMNLFNIKRNHTLFTLAYLMIMMLHYCTDPDPEPTSMEDAEERELCPDRPLKLNRPDKEEQEGLLDMVTILPSVETVQMVSEEELDLDLETNELLMADLDW